MDKNDIGKFVSKAVEDAPVLDMHTHLFPASFEELSLWGPDELITYHYLIAEAIRASHMKYSDFWELDKKSQADFIFRTLFVERTPLSESCRGVLTTFSSLGIDLSSMNLDEFRNYFLDITAEEYMDRVFKISKVEKVVMTNDPFDKKETEYWDTKGNTDKRFLAALRLDVLLNNYRAARYDLIEWGYEVGRSLNGIAMGEIRRFLSDSIKKINAVYMAVSLPADFDMPENDTTSILIEECVLPVAREFNIPLAMMIGVKRQVNQDLFLAGDSLGKSNIEAVEYLCSKYPDNKFMITMLSKENQHELAVTARKFHNLFLFGCWWFLNNPTLIREITSMRMELLGRTFAPQHSDARILDQLIYKWKHSKNIIKGVLIEKYENLYDTGWPVTEEAIESDIEYYFGGGFKEFLKLEL